MISVKDDIFYKEDNMADKILINISIPEKSIERNIEWDLNRTVESLKLYVLKLLPDLIDPLNYGFFLPGNNGKNGKFLQEERLLNHYLLAAPYILELRRKTRINYPDSTKIKKINSKSNQKLFVLSIKNGELMKINKFLSQGLDPNFHVQGCPETPLTLACRLHDPHIIIMALVNNGAYLDFRSTDSLTALHKCAKEGLLAPMQTLLQLGQSPNCKDNKGYTPLYYCIENDAPPECVNLLLYEHSIIGIRDEQGFQEIHKACLYGRTVHLDHLLSYGANIDAKTNKGNTALHICAVHNQGSCARLLLYRGITRNILDSENKSAYQTALLSNNLEIADLIQTFRDEDVVPVTSLPKFNEKRRSIVPLARQFSNSKKSDDETDKSFVQETFTGNSDSCDSESLRHTPKSYNANNVKYRAPPTPDTQSLQNFKNNASTKNISQLNTWSSSDNNFNSHLKTRTPIASIISSKLDNIPRTVVLQKGQHGFGFVIRGIKNESEIIPQPNSFATQYFERVAENSPAHQAGLLTGDFLLEVNNVDVHEMSHDNVVKLIKATGNNLTLKVITVNLVNASNGIFEYDLENKSNSDSQSIISENSANLNSDCVNENYGDSVHITKTDYNTPKTPSNVPNMLTLFPTEAQENLFIKTKLKSNKIPDSQEDNFSGSRISKVLAPPPPIRNYNTSLSVNSSNTDALITSDNTSKNNHIMEPNKLKTSKLFIPPPDYISDETDSKSDRSSVSGSKSVSRSSLYSPILAPPPPPPPSSSIPPPPPPPVPLSPVFCIPTIVMPDKMLQNNLKNNEDNTVNHDVNSSLNNHSEVLKLAVLNHRKKVECGESQPDQIEEKLKENKTGNKSLLFEANIVLPQVTDNSKQTSPTVKPTKNIETADKKYIFSSKNAALNPKPNAQVFVATNSTKPPVTIHPKPNKMENSSNNNEINLRTKAEFLLKKEQENKKGTMYFTKNN